MAAATHPPIQIVDENDAPLRGGTMDEVQLQGLWYRIARVMIYDESTGKYLLQKIAPNPYWSGGLWNTTAGGHVDEAESYLQAALRETEEEMGIVGLDLVEIDRYTGKRTKANRSYNRHIVTFLARCSNTPQVIPNEEVEEIIWVSPAELVAMDTVTDGLRRFIQQYSGDHHGN